MSSTNTAFRGEVGRITGFDGGTCFRSGIHSNCYPTGGADSPRRQPQSLCQSNGSATSLMVERLPAVFRSIYQSWQFACPASGDFQ